MTTTTTHRPGTQGTGTLWRCYPRLSSASGDWSWLCPHVSLRPPSPLLRLSSVMPSSCISSIPPRTQHHTGQTMGSKAWGLFDDEGAEALRNYKYVGVDNSLAYKHALSPFAEYMVQTFVPLWIAPNLITLLGLIFPLISLGIFAWHSPHFKTEPPAWTFFFNAFALFAYQTLDNMDGKQARRTQSSNALGMVFDHGCDAINAGIGAINLLVVLGIVSSGEWDAFLVLSAFASPFIPFYVATWEEYYTGALVLPIINGPAEGVLMGVFISLVSGFLGPAWWGRENGFLLALNWLPLKRPGDLIGWFSLMGVIVTCTWQISHVLFLQFQKGRSLLQPIQDLLPFVALAAGTYQLVSTKHDFLTEAPMLTMGAVSAIFVEQVVSLMLAHMTHSPYVAHQRILLPAFLGFVALATVDWLQPVKEGFDAVEGRLSWLWQGHFVLVFGYTFLYLVLVVGDLSRVLGVRPFRIKGAGGGGGGGNGAKKRR